MTDWHSSSLEAMLMLLLLLFKVVVVDEAVVAAAVIAAAELDPTKPPVPSKARVDTGVDTGEGEALLVLPGVLLLGRLGLGAFVVVDVAVVVAAFASVIEGPDEGERESAFFRRFC